MGTRLMTPSTDTTETNNRHKVFMAVQTAVGGEPVKDAWSALNDSFALCIGYASETLEEADRRIDLACRDLKAAVRRYQDDIWAARNPQ